MSNALGEPRLEPSSKSEYLQPSAAGLEEQPAAPALEVIVLWGESVLHVSHLLAPYRFQVGEAETLAGAGEVDFVIGRETLGVERLPIVADVAGAANVVFTPGARGVIGSGDTSIALDELASQGLLEPWPELPGARSYRLPPSAAAWVEHAGFTFVIRPSTAPSWADLRRERLSLRRHTWALSSSLVHALVLLAFYMMPPRSAALSLDRLDADSRLVKYMVTPLSSDPPLPDLPESMREEAQGGTGRAHEGDSGKMGDKQAPAANKRFAIKGRPDNPDPHMSRDMAKEEALNAGVIGILRTATGSLAPTSQYGRDSAEGNDAVDALGNLFGANIGVSDGIGGLGAIGTGRGGGGTGKGTIGTGKLGTIGHGSGDGRGVGYGSGAGGFHGRDGRVPRVRSAVADVLGSLSKEVIRRVIGRHISEVRYCYEQSLMARPDLQGRVTVNFAIAPSGAVQQAVRVPASSDLHDTRAEECIENAVRRWTFPAPEGGGLVVVTYPFLLSQVGN